mmetsp:Transcript_101429/g.325933  ORF Transcript_101429/g.325933 Transcript_101429/m.325933 type:complete len:533 (+) Transcript_101429:31-1629(+)
MGDEDDEEEQEDDDLKDGAPTFGKDGRPQGPLPPFDASPRPQEGKVLDMSGVGVYQTGSSSPVGILLVSDLYGWNSGRVRSVADYLAKSLNAIVVVPRLLDKPPFGEGTDGDGLPPEFQTAERQKELRTWLMRYVWNTYKPKLEAAAVALRSNGAKRIAQVGFCFGAWVIFKASEIITEVVANVAMYPNLHFLEELHDGNPHKLANRLRGPVMFVPAKDCPSMYGPEGDLYQSILRRHPNDAESFPHLDMVHDFVLRGDVADPKVKSATEDAILATGKFLRKFLWPPPVGFNAATLRLMCQDGDHEMVHELLSAGIPSTGKDCRDIIGLMPMHYAAKSDGSVQAIKMLIEYEADVNIAGGIGHETPLHIAAGLSSQKAVKALLQARADPNKPDKGGQTALHYACREGSVQCVQALMNGKVTIQADAGAKDRPSEQTPLHLAAWFGREGICLFMLKARADVAPEDLRAQTPQKRALQHGFEALANIFEAEQRRRDDEALLAEEVAATGGGSGAAAGVAAPGTAPSTGKRTAGK